MRSGINVVIPMGGIGMRFQKEGYRLTKPMCNIVGRPMICWLLDNLVLHEEDTIWVAVMESMDDQFRVCGRLRNEYPKLDFRFVTLHFATRGAAETMYIILNAMPEHERKRRLISLDCDCFYFTDILTPFRNLPPQTSCSYYFEDHGPKPIFSYIILDDYKNIMTIREKEKVSSHANTGAYGFASGDTLLGFCRQVIDLPVGAIGGGEYYISGIINKMLIAQERFTGIHVEDFHVVGTPIQLEEFLTKVKTQPELVKHKARFCIDLDNTLLTLPTVPGDYTTCKPIARNVQVRSRPFHAPFRGLLPAPFWRSE
ncbi:hypothetical protein CYMTET_43632 [Cymbomonas tetramitiformis]|uniref:Nucleotidyl transferase domain-containing protein n=1 Tax=Cymbomonas tetramitiformis TaxID=36881 RepID=A0AAE0C320_9CHLO|nr:hypothetical protein CYMTET_43632 [Cymbomonas tetramitiformis]